MQDADGLERRLVSYIDPGVLPATKILVACPGTDLAHGYSRRCKHVEFNGYINNNGKKKKKKF